MNGLLGLIRQAVGCTFEWDDMSHDVYENPLISRYASREMAELWGAQRKFSTWRRLWVALAEAEAELGLPITHEQIAQLKSKVDDIDF